MENEMNDPRLEPDPELSRWLASTNAPTPAELDRLSHRISAAARSQVMLLPRRGWGDQAAAWSRVLLPLATAAGIAAAIAVARIHVPVAVELASASEDPVLLDAVRRSDAGSYLTEVALSGYRADWANSLVGSK
jgi:hypothetical protein